MLNSMTGFARSERETQLGTLSWEIRSVNHRYLDTQFRLPESLRKFDLALRKIVSAGLSRGKIDCVFNLRVDAEQTAAIEIDATLLRHLRDAAATVSGIFREAQPPSVVDIMRWPGIIRETSQDEESLLQNMSESLTQAIEALAAMRQREGEHLAQLILSRCDDVEQLAEQVRVRRPEVIEGIRNKLADKIAKLGVETDATRLETELVLLAQKLDVDEELDRLQGHLVEIRRIIAKGGACGRKLDFLIQELNREANTLSSKSSDSQTTRAAVDMKVAIEQMREQVQNVE